MQDGLGAALYVLMPILAQAFGLSYAQVGIIRAANNCASSLLEMPSGVLAERFGERRLLVFGLICAGAGYLCLSFAAGLWTILLSLLVLGTGGAFQHALSSSLISNSHDAGTRRSALGIYNSSGDVGKLLFTGLFGLATGIGLAWQGVVAGLAAIAFLAALFVFFGLRRSDGGKDSDEVSAPKLAGRSGDWGIEDRQGFMALCITVFLDTAVQTSFLVFVVFVVAEKGIATHLAAFAVVLTLIGGIFGKAGCGYLAQRIGVRSAFVLAQCATALGIVAVALGTPMAAFALLPVLGMFLQGSTSITYGAIADLISSNRQSRGFAMIYTVSSLSAIVGPTVFGVLSDYSGLGTAMLAMAAVSLLAIPPSLLLKARSEQMGGGAA
ncbi:MAG: MFS transporter [Alphaproteobacteria bacterium]|nr:MFS transporter [Alphaproteobacteria bacterium]